MQISLFSASNVKHQYNRSAQYMIQRDFKLKYSLAPIMELQINSEEFEKFKSRISNLADKVRHYTRIGGICQDSHFELELLSVAEYSKEYTTVIDFSDCLDFMLACFVDCKQENIRKIDNYEQISNAIMNCNFRNAESIPLTELLLCDAKIAQRFDQINMESADILTDANHEYAMLSYINNFFNHLTKKIYELESYCATAIAFDYDGALRSRSYGQIIVSCSKLLEDGLVVDYTTECGNTISMSPKIKVFRRYEYANWAYGGDSK